MNPRTMSRNSSYIVVAILLAGAAHAGSPAAPVEFTPPDFTAADKNRDDQIDPEERRLIVIDRFEARDSNDDGRLTADELPSETFPGDPNDRPR